jgi:hypothetical protein
MPSPLVVGQYLNGHRLILSDGVHPDLSESKPCCLLDLLQALQVMKAPRVLSATQDEDGWGHLRR